MRLQYTESALDTLKTLPQPIRKAFYKQAAFLVQNLRHPSLRAEKYNAPRTSGRPASIRTGDSIFGSWATPTSLPTSPRTLSKLRRIPADRSKLSFLS
jgi:hypothetical protein